MLVQFAVILLLIYRSAHGKEQGRQPGGKALLTRIIGGFDAEAPERYPYMASIVEVKSRMRPICGAAIVSETKLLTSAHCFLNNSKGDLSIIAGVIDLRDRRRVRREIESVTIHEGYSSEAPMDHPDQQSFANDIALIEVTEPFYFNKKVQAVQLPTKEVKESTNCIITGRGISSFKGGEHHNEIFAPNRPNQLRTRYPTKLQVASLLINNQFTCLRITPTFIQQIMLCAGSPSGFGPNICVGDFGSPLVCDNELQGIASFRYDVECKGRVLTPGYFTKVSAYVEWLKDQGLTNGDDYSDNDN